MNFQLCGRFLMPEIPETGRLALIRDRPAIIRKVVQVTDESSSSKLNVCSTEYLDGWRFPEEDKIIWEREVDPNCSREQVFHLSLRPPEDQIQLSSSGCTLMPH